MGKREILNAQLKFSGHIISNRRVITTVGKPVWADGSGFQIFYAADRNRLRHAMSRAGLEEVRFRFDFEGTKVLFG